MPDSAPDRWAVTRPPRTGLVLVAIAVWLLIGLLGAGFGRMILVEPSWWPGLIVGLAVGLLVPIAVWRGTKARVDAEGVLYFGHAGRENIAVPLALCSQWCLVRGGILHGIGVDCPPESVRFLHRSGMKPRDLVRNRERLGFSLILEGLTADDLRDLQAQAEAVATA